MPSRFLSLPTELRNRIYALVFKDDTSGTTIDLSKAREHVPQVALTRVNKQIHDETLDMYCEATTDFWSKHSLGIQIDSSGTNYRRCRCEDDIPKQLDCLHNESGFGVMITKLTFTFNTKQDGPYDESVRISLEVDGKGGAKWTHENKLSGEGFGTLFYNVGMSSILKLSRQGKSH